jgi:hypothetical protein
MAECDKCGRIIKCVCCGKSEYDQSVGDGHSFVPKKCNCRGELTQVIGDVTTPQRASESEIVYLPHVCNDIGGWGAGVVLAISRKWTNPERLYRHYMDNHRQGLERLGDTVFAKCSSHVVVCNMIAQHEYQTDANPRPLKYTALVKCMIDVATEIIRHKGEYLFSTEPPKFRIHCPKFGSDLAGGNWEFILALIEDIWLEAGIDVVVYEYVG